jgi:hypothetical protein
VVADVGAGLGDVDGALVQTIPQHVIGQLV